MPLTPPPTGAPRRSVGQARRLLTWRLGVRPALRRFPGHSLGLHGIPSGYAIGSCPRPPAGGTPFAVPAKGVGWRGLPSPHASPVCAGGVSGPLKFGRRILCGSLIPRRSRYIARRHGGLFRRQGARLPRPAGVVGGLPSTTHALGRCLPLAPALCAHALITSAAARCSLSRARGSARRARHRLRARQGARARVPPLLRPWLHWAPSGYTIGACPRPPAGGIPFGVPAKGVGWRGRLSPRPSPALAGVAYVLSTSDGEFPARESGPSPLAAGGPTSVRSHREAPNSPLGDVAAKRLTFVSFTRLGDICLIPPANNLHLFQYVSTCHWPRR